MRSFIFSECRDRRMGVMWLDLGALTTARAREFGRFTITLTCGIQTDRQTPSYGNTAPACVACIRIKEYVQLLELIASCYSNGSDSTHRTDHFSVFARWRQC